MTTITNEGYAFGSHIRRWTAPKYEYRGTQPPRQFRGHITNGHCLNAMNQQLCGGCWSFAVNGALADRYNIKMKGGFNRWFSPQFLIACDMNSYDHGCGGSNDVEKAAQDLIAKGGTYLYKDYPFDSKQGLDMNCIQNCIKNKNCKPQKCPNQKCVDSPESCENHTNKCTAPTTSGLYRFAPVGLRKVSPENNYIHIKEALLAGPVVTTFIVTSDFMQKGQSDFFKNGGIYQYDGKGTMEGGHAVSICGYGEDSNGRLYWIIKNSWDVSWGMGGYFYVYAKQPLLMLTKDPKGNPISPSDCQQNGGTPVSGGCGIPIGFSENVFTFDDVKLVSSGSTIPPMDADQMQTYKTLGVSQGQNVSKLPVPPGTTPEPSPHPSPPHHDGGGIQTHHALGLLLLAVLVVGGILYASSDKKKK